MMPVVDSHRLARIFRHHPQLHNPRGGLFGERQFHIIVKLVEGDDGLVARSLLVLTFPNTQPPLVNPIGVVPFDVEIDFERPADVNLLVGYSADVEIVLSGRDKVLRVPTTLIVPMIFVLCVVGTYALSSRLFDVWTMLLFGVLGYVLRQYKFPVAPLVLGIVLGDLMEKSLRRGLVLSDGDLTPFFTRPIAGSIFALIAIVLLMRAPLMQNLFKRKTP